MNAVAFLWSDDKIEELKQLWSEGHSASQIARMIGNPSRNSVLSKVHRMGLADRSTTPLNGSFYHKPLRTKPMPVPLEEPEALRLNDGAHVTLETVEHDMCRWPIGDPQAADFHVCGQKTAPRSPYCPFHSRRAWASGAQPSKAEHDAEMAA